MFNLLAQKSNSYIADAIYGYFAKTLGSWQSVVQIAVVFAFAILLVFFLAAAIFNPKTLRKRKEKKIHVLHAKIVKLNSEIAELKDECDKIDEDAVKAKNDAEKKIATLRLCDKNLSASAPENGKDFKNTETESEKRADVLGKMIYDVNRNLEIYNRECDAKKTALNAKRKAKENELNSLLDKSKTRRKGLEKKSAKKGSYPELDRRRKLQESEIRALEELRVAKEEYELACERRAQAEKNRVTALENAKAEIEEKRKLDKLIKQTEKSDEQQIPATNEPVAEQDRTEVQLIISDPNGNGEAIITESPAPIEPQSEPVEEKVETETKSDDDIDDFVQLTFDDDFHEEVVFTQVDADDGTIISQEEVTPPAPVTDEITATNTETTNLTSAENAYLEGFSPEEPNSLWKIVKSDDQFVAYLIANGRKIARTDKQPTVPLVKADVVIVKKYLKKRRAEYVDTENAHYFVVNNKKGKPILYGERRGDEESSRRDAETAFDLVKSDIKVII